MPERLLRMPAILRATDVIGFRPAMWVLWLLCAAGVLLLLVGTAMLMEQAAINARARRLRWCVWIQVLPAAVTMLLKAGMLCGLLPNVYFLWECVLSAALVLQAISLLVYGWRARKRGTAFPKSLIVLSVLQAMVLAALAVTAVVLVCF